jgi:hypothetical protein
MWMDLKWDTNCGMDESFNGMNYFNPFPAPKTKEDQGMGIGTI